MNHSEKRSSRLALPQLSRLQNLQGRLLVLLGAVYLVTMLILGGSVAYFFLLTEGEAWLLLGGWILLLIVLALWGTVRILKQHIFLPLEKLQGNLERLERNIETKKMLREQLALREASTAISSSLDLESALNYIAEQMGQIVDVTSVYICSYEPNTKTSAILAEYFGPEACLQERESDLGVRYKLEQAFPDSLEFLQTGQPQITHIDDTELSEPERNHMLQFGAKTTLTIPMQAGGQTIAYAELWESRHQRQFTDNEISLCQDIAQQAALAIENAHLFEQTQAALEETAVLYRVAQNLAQMDNEQEMFELVLTEYLRHLNLKQGGVLIFDDDRAYGSLKAHMVDGKLVEPGLSIPVIGNPSYDQLVENKEPVIIKDVASDKLLGSARELTLGLGIKSLLLVPIMARGEVIGSLGADSVETTHEFTDREIALVEAMANQLGITIENIRLYAESERRAEQLAVLHEIDRAVTTSLRPDDIYYAFAQHTKRLLPYDYLSITLADEDKIRVTYAVNNNSDDTTLPIGTTLPNQASAIGRVISQGQPLLRHSRTTDDRYAKDEALVSNNIQAFMIIPLRIKGRVIGTWNIGSQQVGTYSPDDLEIAQTIADQLAIAVENARLYNEIHQYLEELYTLDLISQTINSTLNLQKMLTTISQHTIRLLGVEAVSVILYDEINNNLWFAAASGGNQDFISGRTMEMGQGIVGWVVQEGLAALVLDVSKDPRFFGQFDQESGFTTRSILCVPLQTKGQTIGAIEVMNKKGSSFDKEDLRLLVSLTAPAATAIENARLYEQAQQEITERKRAEAALEEERTLLAKRIIKRTADLEMANKELARASRLKDEFLASMSHELRTPLTAVLGLCDVLKLEVYGPLSEKQLKSVNSIEESGRHLLELINDILDLSKIEAGKLELRTGPVSIERICHASMQFIKQTAHTKNIDTSLTIDSSISTLQADERHFKQILVNLLSNAVKFTPEGGSIGLEVTGDRANKRIRFTVWDTGIGISQEDMGRLFEPFVQLDSRLARQHPGTGLGLVLVHRMVEMHKGETSVESEVGQGSRFTVSFPWPDQAPRPKLVTESTEAAEAGQSGTPKRTHHTQSPLILVAEDDIRLAVILTDYLRAKGYRVTRVRNGVEVLEQAKEERPDLILMDVQMPEMDGLEATRCLRADDRLAATPIIVLTALAMPGDRERSLEAGATDYISKPMDFDRLVEVIEAQLNKAPS